MTKETGPSGINRMAALMARLGGLRTDGWRAVNPRTNTPSGRLKGLLDRLEGEPYDRNPCPHTLAAWDEIPDPQRPHDPHRARLRRTLVPCERPAGHVHEEASAARMHSGTGHTW